MSTQTDPEGTTGSCDKTEREVHQQISKPTHLYNRLIREFFTMLIIANTYLASAAVKTIILSWSGFSCYGFSTINGKVGLTHS